MQIFSLKELLILINLKKKISLLTFYDKYTDKVDVQWSGLFQALQNILYIHLCHP